MGVYHLLLSVRRPFRFGAVAEGEERRAGEQVFPLPSLGGYSGGRPCRGSSWGLRIGALGCGERNFFHSSSRGVTWL